MTDLRVTTLTADQINAELRVMRQGRYIAAQSKNGKMTRYYNDRVTELEKEQDRRRGK